MRPSLLLLAILAITGAATAAPPSSATAAGQPPQSTPPPLPAANLSSAAPNANATSSGTSSGAPRSIAPSGSNATSTGGGAARAAPQAGNATASFADWAGRSLPIGNATSGFREGGPDRTGAPITSTSTSKSLAGTHQGASWLPVSGSSLEWRIEDMAPWQPVAKALFTVRVNVVNRGATASKPTALQLWTGDDLSRIPVTLQCNSVGEAGAQVPALPPGTSRILTIPNLRVTTAGSKRLLIAFDTPCVYGGVSSVRNHVYTVTEDPAPMLWIPPDSKSVTTSLESEFSYLMPRYPAPGATIHADVTVVNIGSLPVPAGTKVTVWLNQPTPATFNPLCGEFGDGIGELSAPLAPGATTIVRVPQLTAPANPNPNANLLAVTDFECALDGTPPTTAGRRRTFKYAIRQVTGPVFWFDPGSITISPAVPKAKSFFSVTVNITNIGSARGRIGFVTVWPDEITRPASTKTNVCSTIGGFSSGPFQAIEPGASARVTIANVLAPAVAGPYTLVVGVDSKCQAQGVVQAVEWDMWTELKRNIFDYTVVP